MLDNRRPTNVAGIFPNEASCLRFESALLMEISETRREAGYICHLLISEVLKNGSLDHYYRKDLYMSKYRRSQKIILKYAK
jgi:hypothetical protein